MTQRERDLRITQVALSRGFGGAERYFVDLCLALARRGYPVQAICPRNSDCHRLLTGQDAGASLQLVPVTVLGAWDRFSVRAIRNAMRRFSPDIVHTHMARGSLLGGRAAAGPGIPVVTTLHANAQLKYYRFVDRFDVITTRQREYLLSEGIPAGRMEWIPNFSALNPVTGRRRSGSHPLRWLAYGRFVPKKGFDLLLDAFARVAGSDPDARLCLAGDGPCRSALLEQIHRLGIGDRVDLVGWVDDVRGLLADADVFVLPSLVEPFGIVLLEAMACGVPIVASRTDGPLDVLDETTAWLCAVGDVGDLARAMEQAGASEAGRAARAEAALERYRSRYHEDAVVPRLLDFYRATRG